MNERKWVLPCDGLEASADFMRPLGAAGKEGLALWFGSLQTGNTAVISHVVQPFGPGFQTTPLYLRLSMRAVGQLTEYAEMHGLFLVGQIHSHPGKFIDLSAIDVRQGFRIQDFLSVVCPYYAQDPRTRMEHCGLHVFDLGDYRRLSAVERNTRVLISGDKATRARLEVDHD